VKRTIVLAALAMLAPRIAEAAQCQGRPTDPAGYAGYTYGSDPVKTYDTPQIRVHYATTGVHAPTQDSTRPDGVPDLVAMAGDIGEDALTRYAQMGFKKIPDDSSCASNGGDSRTDIYIVTFSGADGTTAPDACNGTVCSSFVLSQWRFIGSGYASTEEGLKTVVSHELFHCVQNAYNSQLDRFWAEGSAQWAMKTLHPELGDFERQLPAFFSQSSKSLDAPPNGAVAGFLYGSAVWPLYLTLTQGNDAVRTILENEVDGTSAMDAANKMLQAKGTSLADAFPLFGAWNVATKDHAGTGGYPNAANYPGVKLGALAEGANAISSGYDYFGYIGKLDTEQGITLETDATRNAGLVIPLDGGKAQLDKAKKLPANAQGDVVVVVAGVTTKKTDAPFTIHLGAAVQEPPSDDGGASSSGGSSGGGGGCAVAEPNDAGTLAFAFALGGLGLVVIKRRRR
jgi:hypothetical protein